MSIPGAGVLGKGASMKSNSMFLSERWERKEAAVGC